MDQQNPKPNPAPEQRYAAPEIDDILADDPDEAPTEWVPSRFERRIHAIPDKQWDLYQCLGGGLIGAIAVAALFFGGTGVNAGFLIAVVLALLLPNWLEDRGRRKLTKGRYAMIIVMAVGLIGIFLYTGLTKGWDVFTKKTTQEAARMAVDWLRL